MTSQTVVYTVSATIFAILFGELILPASIGNSPPILSNPVTFVAMSFYYDSFRQCRRCSRILVFRRPVHFPVRSSDLDHG